VPQASTREALSAILAILPHAEPVLHVVKIACALSTLVYEPVFSTAPHLALVFVEIGLIHWLEALQARALSARSVFVFVAIDF